MGKEPSGVEKFGTFILKLMILSAPGVFIWKFGATWSQPILFGALVLYLVVALLILYPKMAVPLIDAIADWIHEDSDGSRKNKTPKPPVDSTPTPNPPVGP